MTAFLQCSYSMPTVNKVQTLPCFYVGFPGAVVPAVWALASGNSCRKEIAVVGLASWAIVMEYCFSASCQGIVDSHMKQIEALRSVFEMESQARIVSWASHTVHLAEIVTKHSKRTLRERTLWRTSWTQHHTRTLQCKKVSWVDKTDSTFVVLQWLVQLSAGRNDSLPFVIATYYRDTLCNDQFKAVCSWDCFSVSGFVMFYLFLDLRLSLESVLLQKVPQKCHTFSSLFLFVTYSVLVNQWFEQWFTCSVSKQACFPGEDDSV